MIPKTIHYCWFGRNPKPKLVQKCIASWKKHCPDYKIIEWNEDNYDVTKIPYMKEAYEAKKWGFVPDFARLEIVYQYGGIYLDTDVELIKPLNELLKHNAFSGFESDEYVNYGQGFGAEKGNTVIKKVMESYRYMHFVSENGELNLTPSPQLNTLVLENLGLKRDNSMQKINSCVIYPKDYFCPLDYDTRKLHKTKNTYSIHWFSASWWDEQSHKMKKKYTRKLRFHNFWVGIIGENNYERVKKLIRR